MTGAAEQKATDAEIVAAVERAAAAGERCAAEGGVRITVVSRRVGLEPSSLRHRLRALVEAGELAVVWGVHDGGPCQTWLPTSHDDARQPDERGWAVGDGGER
jgi:hypothetical protein